MKTRVLWTLVLLAMTSFTLNAQSWDKRFAVGAQGNIYKLWGGSNNRSTISSKIGIHALYGIRPNMQLGFETGYGSFRPSETGSILPDDDDLKFRTTVIPVHLLLRATPLENDDIVKPYGQLGVGLLFWDLKNIDENSPENGESVHGQQSNITLSLAAGVEWMFATAWALDLRAQNTFLLAQKLDNTGYGDDANSMMLEGRIGLTYYFKRKAVSAAEGSQDARELQTLEIEQVDDTQENNAASEPDTISDDSSDSIESEPQTLEDSQEVDTTPETDYFVPEQDHVVLVGVNFETGSAELTSDARNVLRTVANQLLTREDIRVRIVGHTDNTGNESINRRLSLDRADAVKQFLMLNGIAANRMVTDGRGSNQPIADNATEEGRARNRRIEFERID